jgi:hypothetical protein
MSGNPWKPETAEELLAKLTAEHGPDVAAIALRAITGELALPTNAAGRRPIYTGRRARNAGLGERAASTPGSTGGTGRHSRGIG